MGFKGFLKRNKDIILVILFFITISSIMQYRVKEIIGYDGWLNIKTADIIKKQGFIKEFPYTTESILADNYSDLHLLFHIILIPFTYLGLINGAKIASIIFASLCFAVFYWYMKKSHINHPFFWTALFAISSVDLMYRFLLPREMPLAVMSLLLAIFFMDKKFYLPLLLISLFFAWLYSAFVIQIFIMLAYFIIDAIVSKKLNYKIPAYSLAGIALAIIINPYFPKNLSLLYIQIFKVNLLGNLYNLEWRPWPFGEFLKHNAILLIMLAASLAKTTKALKFNKKTLFFFSLSIFFLLATIKTRRMHEYFAPFTILFAAFSLNEGTLKITHKKLVKYAITLIIILIASFSLIKLDKDIKNNHFLPWYREGANYLGSLPKNSRVFINGYTFNYLFFYNSNLRYTHGIDLTYSYLYDKDKFSRYIGVLQGKDPGFNIIKEDYDADYAFIGKVKQDIKLFEHIVKYKEDFEVLYEDESAAILKVKK